MAKIINVEKSQYLTQNIETFTQNKVSQYSKFLDKNPIFITYLAINSVQSRSDVGTGGVESDVGPKSPIRYNQINGLPAFNIPDLRPGINFDENGYDLELDLTDVTLLPNTKVLPSISSSNLTFSEDSKLNSALMLLTISSLVKTSLSAFVAKTAFVITKNVNNNTNILLNFFIFILLL